MKHLNIKIFSLESKVSITESMMRKSLEKRIELITNILNIKGSSFVSTDIVMQFHRNLPQNLQMLTDMITKLFGVGILSKQTSFLLLPFIQDTNYELSLIEKEKEDSMYGNFGEEVVVPEDTNISRDNLLII